MDFLDIEKIQAEIVALKNANNELRQMLNDVVKCVIENNTFSETIMKEMKAQTERVLDLYVWMDNLPYEILDSRFKDKYTSIPKIMSEKETIDEIVLNKKSIARFGDGEFALMFGYSRWRFQKADHRLAERLREVITSHDNNILMMLGSKVPIVP